MGVQFLRDNDDSLTQFKALKEHLRGTQHEKKNLLKTEWRSLTPWWAGVRRKILSGSGQRVVARP
jgi:hypothetical protein